MSVGYKTRGFLPHPDVKAGCSHCLKELTWDWIDSGATRAVSILELCVLTLVTEALLSIARCSLLCGVSPASQPRPDG